MLISNSLPFDNRQYTRYSYTPTFSYLLAYNDIDKCVFIYTSLWAIYIEYIDKYCEKRLPVYMSGQIPVQTIYIYPFDCISLCKASVSSRRWLQSCSCCSLSDGNWTVCVPSFTVLVAIFLHDIYKFLFLYLE